LQYFIIIYPSADLIEIQIQVINRIKREISNDLVNFFPVLLDSLFLPESLLQYPNLIILQNTLVDILTQHINDYCSPSNISFNPHNLKELSNTLLMFEKSKDKILPHQNLRNQLISKVEAYWSSILLGDIEDFDLVEFHTLSSNLIGFKRGGNILTNLCSNRVIDFTKDPSDKVERIMIFMDIYKRESSIFDFYDRRNLLALQILQEKLYKISLKFKECSKKYKILLYSLSDSCIDSLFI
jgi:hypothetical protein